MGGGLRPPTTPRIGNPPPTSPLVELHTLPPKCQVVGEATLAQKPLTIVPKVTPKVTPKPSLGTLLAFLGPLGGHPGARTLFLIDF